MERLIEINIDGLIGPTHHFGGLGVGNIASQSNQHRESHPKRAALEGIAKMRRLMDLGVPQFVLLPPDRPNWNWLAQLGYVGSLADVLKRCGDEAPRVLSAAYSSSFMWTANAATVAPGCDTLDGLTHVLPANLCSNLHRQSEANERRDALRELFAGIASVVVHEPLPSAMALRDEGAANHMRLCRSRLQRDKARKDGLHVFVHGPSDHSETNSGDRSKHESTNRFPSRQTLLASQSTARVLRLPIDRCVFLEQSPIAIDAGVFHNDVIATSNENVLIYHEHAFVDGDAMVQQIANRFASQCGERLIVLRVSDAELPLAGAVATYLFNSQLVTLPSGRMHFVCPQQCAESAAVSDLIRRWIDDPNVPIDSVEYVSLQESMANGGGPACLRLRVDLMPGQLDLLRSKLCMTAERADWLERCVERYYPDRVSYVDFTKVEFADFALEAAQALRLVQRDQQ